MECIRSHNGAGQTRLIQDGNRHLELGLVAATSHGTLKNRHQVVAVGQVDYELVTQRARALSKGMKETLLSAVVRYEYGMCRTSKPLTSELCPPDRTTGWIPLAAAHRTTRTEQDNRHHKKQWSHQPPEHIPALVTKVMFGSSNTATGVFGMRLLALDWSQSKEVKPDPGLRGE